MSTAITQAELARRLKAAREACGLTQKEVAGHLGVSRPTLTQIELGNRAVTSIELQQLAYLYGRDLRALLAAAFQDAEPVAALLRAHPELQGQNALRRAIRDCLVIGRELTNLERLLGVDRDAGGIAWYPLRRPKSKWEAIEQGRRVAGEQRRRLGLGSAPISSLAELLDSLGIRTAQVDLPDGISGLTLVEPTIGVFIVSNRTHSYERRRFSYAHELAHGLLDRDQPGIVSRSADRDELVEVRANVFAADFLMPADGIASQVRALGKGRASRMQAEVFDETGTVEVRARAAPGSQDLQLYDVAQIAHHFGTSRPATLYRLRNLRLITAAQLQELEVQEERHGRDVARLLALPRPDDRRDSNEFRYRFFGLAIEAFRREEITRDKLYGLARLVGVERRDVVVLLEQMGLTPDEGEDEPLLPEM
ncbi:MAG: ImmA/IrrE family metallo-endopeptidase [bacterium]|nr:ImmA/IrrE family metallo-endopeptidase [bacterium]